MALSVPLPPTASDVIARANKLASWANELDAQVHANTAKIDPDNTTQWSIFYSQQVAPTVDPYTDPLLGIVTNPPSAMAEMDPIEASLNSWSALISQWTGTSIPTPSPTPTPSVPLPLPELDTSTKLLIGLGLVAVIMIARKL